MKSLQNTFALSSKYNIYIITLLLFALIVRLTLFILLDPFSNDVAEKELFIRGDGKNYHELAINIIESGNFQNFNPKRVPGYPVTIALVYLIFGTNPGAVIFFQLFLNTLSVYLLIRLASLLFGSNIGFISGALYAFDPHNIFYSLTIHTETFFICLFLFAMILSLRALQTKRVILFIYTGIFFTLATYFKNIAIFFPFLFSGLLIIFYKLNRSWLNRILLMLIIYCGLLTPWYINNYIQYGSIGFSTLRGRNMLLYNVALCEANKTGENLRVVKDNLKTKVHKLYKLENSDPIYVANRYARYSQKYIISNLYDYTVIHFRGIRNAMIDQGREMILDYFMDDVNQTSNDNSSIIIDYKLVYGRLGGRLKAYFNASNEAIILGIAISIYMIVIYTGFIMGFVGMVLQRQHKRLLFILFILVYYLGLTGVVGYARYKLPIVPFYSMVSAVGFWTIYKYFRHFIRKPINVT